MIFIYAFIMASLMIILGVPIIIWWKCTRRTFKDLLFIFEILYSDGSHYGDY